MSRAPLAIPGGLLVAIMVNADGLCLPVNPGGIACYGWVAHRDGAKIGEGWGEAARGPGATNNLAEYRAVVAALEWLLAEGLAGERVLVWSDAQLVTRQIQGEYAVKSDRILPLYRRVRMLAGRLASLGFEWVPRETNREADLLSRRAYGEVLAGYRAGGSRGLPVEPAGGTVLFRVGSSDGSRWYRVVPGGCCRARVFLPGLRPAPGHTRLFLQAHPGGAQGVRSGWFGGAGGLGRGGVGGR